MLSESDQRKRLASAREKLKEAGAHFVIDSVAEITQTVRTINEMLAGKLSQATCCP